MTGNGHERSVADDWLAAGADAPLELHTPAGPGAFVPLWVAKAVSGGALKLYIILSARAQAYIGAARRPRPTYAALAQDLGVSRRTVIDYVAELAKAGALLRHRSRLGPAANLPNVYTVLSDHPDWPRFRDQGGVQEFAPGGSAENCTQPTVIPVTTDSPTLSLGATRGAKAPGAVAAQQSLPGIPKPGDQVWLDYKAIVNPKAKTKPWREIHNLLRPGRYTVDELRQCMEKWRSSLWHQAGAKTRPPTPKQFFDSEYIERLHALDVQAANVRYKRQQAKERAEAGPGPGIESRWIPPQEQQP